MSERAFSKEYIDFKYWLDLIWINYTTKRIINDAMRELKIDKARERANYR